MNFAVRETEKDSHKWIVCLYPNYGPFINMEFETIELARLMANKLTEVYNRGVIDSQEIVMNNLREMLFKN